MSYLVNPTLPLESDHYQVIEPMQSLVRPTLPLESDLHQVVELMPSSINSTLSLESESFASHVFFTTSSEPSGQGGTDFFSNEPPLLHHEMSLIHPSNDPTIFLHKRTLWIEVTITL